MGAAVIDHGHVPTVSARNLAYEGEPEPATLMTGCRLGAEAFLEDLSIESIGDARARVVNLDDDLGILLGHRDADPPLSDRRRGPVERVVHEVPEQCDHVLAVDPAALQ